MIHPLLLDAFCAFEHSGVRWCLLRVPSNPAAPSGDVDVLIDRTDAARVREALNALGFVQLPVPSHGPDAFFLSYHQGTDRWIWLHLVSELNFGPGRALCSGAAAGCLDRRQSRDPMVVLAPDDAFWTLLLHCLLDKGAVSARHRLRLQELEPSARVDGQLAQVVEGTCPVGWTARRMLECVRRSDWAALESALASVAAWRRPQPRTARMDRIPHLLQRLPALPGRLRARLRGRGVSIAVLGPDGAGKSTVAAGIQTSFFFPVRAVYMGLGDDRIAPIARIRVPGRALVLALTLLWRYATAQYHQARGRLVIFDRYSYDALHTASGAVTRRARLGAWLLAHSCPMPDLVLVLDVPGEVMYRRKGERNPASLEAERQRLLALGHRVRRLQIVDATRSQDAVRSDVVGRIWSLYASRWSTP
jgi:thymidylate kinase